MWAHPFCAPVPRNPVLIIDVFVTVGTGGGFMSVNRSAVLSYIGVNRSKLFDQERAKELVPMARTPEELEHCVTKVYLGILAQGSMTNTLENAQQVVSLAVESLTSFDTPQLLSLQQNTTWIEQLVRTTSTAATTPLPQQARAPAQARGQFVLSGSSVPRENCQNTFTNFQPQHETQARLLETAQEVARTGGTPGGCYMAVGAAGIGKSHVAVALAKDLARQGRSVLWLDSRTSLQPGFLYSEAARNVSAVFMDDLPFPQPEELFQTRKQEPPLPNDVIPHPRMQKFLDWYREIQQHTPPTLFWCSSNCRHLETLLDVNRWGKAIESYREQGYNVSHLEKACAAIRQVQLTQVEGLSERKGLSHFATPPQDISALAHTSRIPGIVIAPQQGASGAHMQTLQPSDQHGAIRADNHMVDAQAITDISCLWNCVHTCWESGQILILTQVQLTALQKDAHPPLLAGSSEGLKARLTNMYAPGATILYNPDDSPTRFAFVPDEAATENSNNPRVSFFNDRSGQQMVLCRVGYRGHSGGDAWVVQPLEDYQQGKTTGRRFSDSEQGSSAPPQVHANTPFRRAWPTGGTPPPPTRPAIRTVAQEQEFQIATHIRSLR